MNLTSSHLDSGIEEGEFYLYPKFPTSFRKIEHFCELADEIKLEGRWEAGLISASFPAMRRPGKARIHFAVGPDQVFQAEMIDNDEASMKETWKKLGWEWQFMSSDEPFRFAIFGGKPNEQNWMKILDDPVFYEYVGIDIETGVYYELPIIGNRRPDYLFDFVQIRSSLFETQYVGDEKVNLINQIFPPKLYESSFVEFYHPRYVPVQHGYIKKLEFQFTTLNWSTQRFHSGDINLVLHFKRRRIYSAMTTEPFYLWAMSNAPNPNGTDNKPQEFTISTPHTDQLQGKWEVAVIDATYPNNWNNILKPAKIFVKQLTMQQKLLVQTLEIPAGNYKTVDEIIEKLNEKCTLGVFSVENERVKFVWNSEGLGGIQIPEEGIDLMELLGFNIPKFTPRVLEPPMKGDHQFDLKLHLPALYVYCNFIDYQYVGNVRGPLLALLPVKEATGSYIYTEFKRDKYLPLSSGYINTLTFEIRDDSGRLMQFDAGKVTFCLHFRPQRI